MVINITMKDDGGEKWDLNLNEFNWRLNIYKITSKMEINNKFITNAYAKCQHKIIV